MYSNEDNSLSMSSFPIILATNIPKEVDVVCLEQKYDAKALVHLGVLS